jgi:hypothetical protein
LENDKDEYFLSETEKVEIREFAIGGDTKARNQAKSFMEFYYDEYLFDNKPNSNRMANNKPKNENKINVPEKMLPNFEYLSPNPAKNSIAVTIDNAYPVILSDALGNIISRTNYYNNKIVLDISNLANGLYFICNGKSKSKLVVQN